MAAALIVSMIAAGCNGAASSAPIVEWHGVWLTNVDSDVLTPRRRSTRPCRFGPLITSNGVFPVVWNDAYTRYPSALTDRLYRAVKAEDPALHVSWAPGIYPWSCDAYPDEYPQDGPMWTESGHAN